MYALIIDCHGFVLEHSAYIIDEDGQAQSVAQLPTSEIAGYAVANSVSKICLNGPAEYCFGIGDEIGAQLKTEYSNNNIEIEVM